MQVAFYKHRRGGIKGLFDWLIRLVTRGPYSHCELVFDQGRAYSASMQDGGTRFKLIEFNPDHWDLVPVNMDELPVFWFCKDELGSKYDYPGVFRFLVPWVRESKERWFCSEVCCAALQRAEYLPKNIKAWQVHPSRLYQILTQGRG
jgi:hypothetical protein